MKACFSLISNFQAIRLIRKVLSCLPPPPLPLQNFGPPQETCFSSFLDVLVINVRSSQNDIDCYLKKIFFPIYLLRPRPKQHNASVFLPPSNRGILSASLCLKYISVLRSRSFNLYQSKYCEAFIIFILAFPAPCCVKSEHERGWPICCRWDLVFSVQTWF